MDRDKLVQRLMGTFLLELQEHVRVFNRELLALEQLPGAVAEAESLKTLFRAAHSLKGAARSVNASRIEAVCHRLESLLANVRDESRALTPDLFELLFAAADALASAGDELGRGAPDRGDSGLGGVLARLDAAQSRAAPPSNRTGPTAAAPKIPAPAPPAPMAPPGELPPPPVESAAVVRVPGRKLDELLAQSGELLIARRRLDARQTEIARIQDVVARWRADWRVGGKGATSREITGERLVQLEQDLDRLLTAAVQDGRSLERAAEPLERQIHDVRLVPFAEACEGLLRTVRDLAPRQNKEIDLIVEGGDTELDRSIVDGLRDPLLHLVRNAVDHGVEPSEQRSAAGKARRAKITVSAAVRGDVVEVVVVDDGRGIDVAAVREQAARRNVAVSERDHDLVELLFRPGFTTARLITEVSGRGVGLDVVKTQVENMRGTVSLSFDPGRGTRFQLTLPPTLTTVRAVLVRAAGELFAFPSSHIRKLFRAGAETLGVVEGREVVLMGGPPIPFASLADVLGLSEKAPEALAGKVPFIVTGTASEQVALWVDEILAEQDIVLRPLGQRIRRMKHISGATILPTGSIAVFLKPGDLVKRALARTVARGLEQPDASTASVRKRLLLVDDSVTTRTLERSILEAAGYDVSTAPDGAAAWQLLKEKGADLVVSDVEMPKMDGFALTEAIRGSKRFRDLPVILLTALETERDQARGMDVGADAYLIKSAFDQKKLLETIRRLL